MSRASLVTALLAALLIMPTLACFAERDRLDVPVIQLTLDSDSIAPGDTIGGRIVAADRSGLIGVSVYGVSAATTADSIDRASRSFIDRDSINMTFTLIVSPNAPPGSDVRVHAEVFDNQSFSVGADAVAHVVAR